MAHLQVGVAASCVAPLWVERIGLRLAKLSGVDSLTVPDHYTGFVPRALWKPEYTPAAKMVPSTDAFFDPFVLMGMMATRYRRVRIGTGVTEAYRIENGKLGPALKGAMLIGNGPTDLRRVSMVGNDLALDTGIGTCGKNGQGVPVGVGQPTLRMDRITVGGTG